MQHVIIFIFTIIVGAQSVATAAQSESCDWSPIVVSSEQVTDSFAGVELTIPLSTSLVFEPGDNNLRTLAIETRGNFQNFQSMFFTVIQNHTPDSSCTNRFKTRDGGVELAKGALKATYSVNMERWDCGTIEKWCPILSNPLRQCSTNYETVQWEEDTSGQATFTPHSDGGNIFLTARSVHPKTKASGLLQNIRGALIFGQDNTVLNDLMQQYAKDIEAVIGDAGMDLNNLNTISEDTFSKMVIKRFDFQTIDGVPILILRREVVEPGNTACALGNALRAEFSPAPHNL